MSRTASPNVTVSPTLNPERSRVFSDEVKIVVVPDMKKPSMTDMQRPLLDRKSSPNSSFREGVDALPDLTDRLHEAGLYKQYLDYRQGYLRWRQGGGHGARGDLNAVALETDPRQSVYHFWYPTVKYFQFQRTVSFWILIFFLEGSFMFAFTSLLAYFDAHYPWFRCSTNLENLANIVGSIFFTIGGYLGVFELINLPNKDEDEKVSWFLMSITELRELVPWSSILGYYAYFVGVVNFQVAMVSKAMNSTNPFLVKWQMDLGCVFFFLGGLCECIHNSIFSTPPTKPVWWLTFFNMTGDLLFFVAQFLPMSKPTSSLLYFWGCLCFGIGAIFGLMMWRAEEFGLSLISELNVAHRTPAKNERKLSGRGLTFIVVSACVGALAAGNCCCCFLWDILYNFGVSYMEAAISFIYNCSTVLLIHMFLMLQSANPKIPKEQPHRLLMMLVRFVLGLLLCSSMMKGFMNLERGCFDDPW